MKRGRKPTDLESYKQDCLSKIERLKNEMKKNKPLETDPEEVKLQKIVMRLKYRNQANAQTNRLKAKIREDYLRRENIQLRKS